MTAKEIIQTFQRKIGVASDGQIGRLTLEAAAKYFNMTNESCAHFFGQIHHETGGFRFFVENLNYSEEALLRVFSKYFNRDGSGGKRKASDYARKPMMIGNVVYANRMGNGDVESGDGYRYRGRGPIHLTGRNNYFDFARYIGDGFVYDNPDVVASLYSFESALFFFDSNDLWRFTKKVDDTSIRNLTRRVNGGFNGLADRIKQTNHFYKLLS
jgi:putative chitinase